MVLPCEESAVDQEAISKAGAFSVARRIQEGPRQSFHLNDLDSNVV